MQIDGVDGNDSIHLAWPLQPARNRTAATVDVYYGGQSPSLSTLSWAFGELEYNVAAINNKELGVADKGIH